MARPPERSSTEVDGVLFSDDLDGKTMLFTKPCGRIVARTVEEVGPAFRLLEDARKDGLWAAGFLAYEAGYAFEEKLAPLVADDRETPLLCFGLFDGPAGDDHPLRRQRQDRATIDFLDALEPAWSYAEYERRFDRLHRHLMQGNCYQANLTMQITSRWHGDPLAAFWKLAVRQPVRYAAFVDLGGPVILSRSPELFFRTDDNGWIETRPMKGTAGRGATPEQDRAIVAAMLKDEKTQAENRMIVDLLRNDLSLVAKAGTVQVQQLFEIETYPTLHQMVSTVQAELTPDVSLRELFAALFPCGSITGAPKLSAMQILHALEDEPRDAYCGAIGMISPTGAMRFSVAIRTISLFDDGRAVFNVGGGIVLDSKPEAEYAEALLKARFASRL